MLYIIYHFLYNEFQMIGPNSLAIDIAIYILLFVTIYILREYFLDIILRNELNINVWHMILITSILYHVNDSCSCTYFIRHLYIDSISISMNKIHIVMTEVFMLVYKKNLSWKLSYNVLFAVKIFAMKQFFWYGYVEGKYPIPTC